MAITIKNRTFTLTFEDVYPSYESFSSDYASAAYKPFETGDMLDSNHLGWLYQLLLARHGTDRIASVQNAKSIADDDDPIIATQFKRRFWAIVGIYGGTWQRKHKIQLSMRSLSDDDVTKGAKQFSNTANNPSQSPDTDYTEGGLVMKYIDAQGVTIHQKAKMEGLNVLWESLHDDVTEYFLKRFDKLFKVAIDPWYNIEEVTYE